MVEVEKHCVSRCDMSLSYVYDNYTNHQATGPVSFAGRLSEHLNQELRGSELFLLCVHLDYCKRMRNIIYSTDFARCNFKELSFVFHESLSIANNGLSMFNGYKIIDISGFFLIITILEV